MFRQYLQRRSAVSDHDVDGERRRLREARDQFGIDKTGDEDSVSTRFCVRVCSFDGVLEHSVAVFGGWSLEEHVGTGVDEETDTRCIRRPPSASNALALIDRLTEFSVSRKTVFQVTAYGTCFDGQTDGFGGGCRRVAIAPFQIDPHRQAPRPDAPAPVFPCRALP